MEKRYKGNVAFKSLGWSEEGKTGQLGVLPRNFAVDQRDNGEKAIVRSADYNLQRNFTEVYRQQKQREIPN
jgi:hypothetical protein